MPGISVSGLARLGEFECRRFWPGAVEEYFRYLQALVKHPAHRVDQHVPVNGFCPPYGYLYAVEVVESAAASLPRRDARRFRARLAELYRAW